MLSMSSGDGEQGSASGTSLQRLSRLHTVEIRDGKLSVLKKKKSRFESSDVFVTWKCAVCLLYFSPDMTTTRQQI